MDFGWHGDLDLRAAVDLLARRTDVADGRIGSSAFRWAESRPVGAMAADDQTQGGRWPREPPTGVGRLTRRGSPTSSVGAGCSQEQLDRLTYGATDLLTSVSPPHDACSESAAGGGTAPVLLVASAASSRGGRRSAGSSPPGRPPREGVARARRAHRRARGRPHEWTGGSDSSSTLPSTLPGQRAVRPSACGQSDWVSWAVPPGHRRPTVEAHTGQALEERR